MARKPPGICQYNGCRRKIKGRRRKFCADPCSEKSRLSKRTNGGGKNGNGNRGGARPGGGRPAVATGFRAWARDVVMNVKVLEVLKLQAERDPEFALKLAEHGFGRPPQAMDVNVTGSLEGLVAAANGTVEATG